MCTVLTTPQAPGKGPLDMCPGHATGESSVWKENSHFLIPGTVLFQPPHTASHVAVLPVVKMGFLQPLEVHLGTCACTHTRAHTEVHMYAYTHKRLLGIRLIIFQSQGSFPVPT